MYGMHCDSCSCNDNGYDAALLRTTMEFSYKDAIIFGSCVPQNCASSHFSLCCANSLPDNERASPSLHLQNRPHLLPEGKFSSPSRIQIFFPSPPNPYSCVFARADSQATVTNFKHIRGIRRGREKKKAGKNLEKPLRNSVMREHEEEEDVSTNSASITLRDFPCLHLLVAPAG